MSRPAGQTNYRCRHARIPIVVAAMKDEQAVTARDLEAKTGIRAKDVAALLGVMQRKGIAELIGHTKRVGQGGGQRASVWRLRRARAP